MPRIPPVLRHRYWLPVPAISALVLAAVATGCPADDAAEEGGSSSDTAAPTSSSATTAASQSSSVATSDVTVSSTGTETSGTAGTSGGTSPTTDSATTSTGTGPGDCIAPGSGLDAEPVVFATTDEKSIAAVISRPSPGSCLPGVVLVHQFTNSKAQWDAHIASFVDQGFVTLALDLRGHGESDPQDGALADILTDPEQAPRDVQAAIEFLQADPSVDASRIAVVGTSIGANLAVVAGSADLGVTAVVAVSARLSAIESLSASAAVELGPLRCYAGETDSNGDQAATCASLEPLSSGPAESVILPGSSAHGVTIIDTVPETVPEILDFLQANL